MLEVCAVKYLRGACPSTIIGTHLEILTTCYHSDTLFHPETKVRGALSNLYSYLILGCYQNHQTAIWIDLHLAVVGILFQAWSYQRILPRRLHVWQVYESLPVCQYS